MAWENAPTQKRLERLYDYDKAGQLKEILDKRYRKSLFENEFIAEINSISDNLKQHRNNNFFGSILQQSRIDQFAGKGPAVICVPGIWGPPWSASAGTCGLPCSAGGDGRTQGR